MEEIWLKLEVQLRAFILSRVKDAAVTEDLLQDVFLKIHANIDQLKDQTKVQAWMYQICRNTIVDHFRKEKRETQKEVNLPEIEDEESGEDFMSQTLEDMIHMMEKMPKEYCEALCLTELKGVSQKDYAALLGISYSGAKSRVQRARIMLKDMLMNCCHYEFDKYGTVIGIHPVKCCCCHPSA